jgi:hypothetical protein
MKLFEKLFGGGKNSNLKPAAKTHFNSSDQLMDEDRFWEIIRVTKERSLNDYNLQQEELATELNKLTPEELIIFANRFRYFRGLAYTWELWGAIYIIHGGCGDDSFNDFREWVIGQGKDFYYKTLKDPGTLLAANSLILADDNWEGLGYVPSTVFEKMTSVEMPYPFQENLEVTGKEWEEEGDDLKIMFPELYKKYFDA